MSTVSKKIKLKGNESFNFREGWLRKGMRSIIANPKAFSADDIMEQLGVGSKMVKSIRFWLQATGLAYEEIVEGGRCRAQHLTPFGHIAGEYDPYFDDIFTLWIIHYHIVSNESLCIAWNMFFNEFSGDEFTKEEMLNVLRVKLLKRIPQSQSFSESSLEDDCQSILKMYLPEENITTPEESLACPLSELGLLDRDSISGSRFSKSMPKSSDLDLLVVFYVMLKNLSEDKLSVSIADLLSQPNNIGRVFNLNRIMLGDYLDKLRALKLISINRTAGLDMVYIDRYISPDSILRRYYNDARK